MFSETELLVSFRACCEIFLDLDLLKEKGQILQLPPEATITFDESPTRDFSTQSTGIMPFCYYMFSTPNRTIPITVGAATSH
jgi:hypothetical protein